MIIHASMAIAAFVGMLFNQDGTSGVPLQPIPSCGFCSAYAFLHASKHTTTVPSLMKSFKGADITAPLTVLQVRNALGNEGVATKAVRFKPEDLLHVPTPSILYISPGRWPRSINNNVGHFVTLVGFVEDRAVILDWSGAQVQPSVYVKVSELSGHWDGVAIVLSAFPWTRLGIVAFLVGSVFVVCRVRNGRWLLFALFVAGCSSKPEANSSSAIPTLVFHEPLASLGEVKEHSLITHDFVFQVWDQSPVVIRDVEASCGCTLPEKSLYGRVLDPGSKHKLKVTVRTDGNVSTQAKSLRVKTEPASSVPLVLAVKYSRRDPPVLSASRFSVESTPDELASGEITVTYHRPKKDAVLKVDKAKSRFGDFVLTDIKQEVGLVKPGDATGGPIESDTLHLRLRATGLHGFGKHESEITFAFTDGSKQSIPSEIVVKHPIWTSSERIWIGVVSPGEERDKSIQVKSPTNSSVAVMHEGMVTSSAITGQVLTVHIIAPMNAGRHESFVTLKSGDLPALRIPVACVVKQEVVK